MASPAPHLTLVLGGARSGKSRFAEHLTSALPPPWIYLATAEAFDAEMTDRIAQHRSRRGSGWQTIETPLELASAMTIAPASAVILADCLTLWLNNLMFHGRDIESEMTRLDGALAARTAPTILVSNEVGSGIVPEHADARRFRDLQGTLNQRVAARAERVVLLVAGLPLFIKGSA